MQEKDNNFRDFKGIWIPREIWLAEDLSHIEKLYLAEIDSLDNGKKGCFASNAYFSRFFKMTPQRAFVWEQYQNPHRIWRILSVWGGAPSLPLEMWHMFSRNSISLSALYYLLMQLFSIVCRENTNFCKQLVLSRA